MVSSKGIAGMFAAVTFFTGFLLIDRGSISGNVVITSEPSAFSAISIAGLALVFVAVLLVFYSIKK